MRYKQYDLITEARLALNYIDGMTDRAYDYLPFWLVMPHKKPAEAEHCRVDDAELVGSWFEAVDSLGGILGEETGAIAELRSGLRRRLLGSWGEHGLRFHEPYPWTHTLHASFHEMGYILPALNRLIRRDSSDREAEERASALVRGLRSLVIERKVRTFWSGDSPEPEPVYEFPNDVYLKDGGFDLTRHTGRGEQPIRNAVMLHALVDRYVLTGDSVALDLAAGLANHLLGPSRYFNYRYEFFGHMHSALWVAAGLLYLGRVTGTERYSTAGEGIYRYARSLSSSYGWLPEYAQWHPQEAEHCETCCIKDVILCAQELILSGKDAYWEDLCLVGRNQLSENQLRYTGYVVCDNSLPDHDGRTFRALDRRLLGGYTGGSEPNSISLTRFRSIAGCCVGTGPIALGILWNSVTTVENGILTVNFHTAKETDSFRLSDAMPDAGRIRLELKRDTAAGFRLYSWMGHAPTLTRNGSPADPLRMGQVLYLPDCRAGDVLELSFPLETTKRKEFFAGREYTEFWRGEDMIDILPRGEHIRLYQRDSALPPYYPAPEEVTYTGVADRGPTQQGKQDSGKR